MKQLIEEQRKDFDIWFNEYPGVPTIGEIQEWYEDRTKQLIESLIEKTQSEMVVLREKEDHLPNAYQWLKGKNEARESFISHLKELRKQLE